MADRPGHLSDHVESLFLTNLSSPPLLFFFLGVAAALLRSDLEIPAQIAKFLSLYLLFAIGFKGGVSLAESGFDASVVGTLVCAVALASVIPVYGYLLLRRRLGAADAAAIAATYGSISAVTFVTATSYLDASSISWAGHLVAAMALMEAPAIIIGLMLYQMRQRAAADGAAAGAVEWRELGRESLLNGSVFLILGSLAIGWITGSRGMSQISPLIGPPFVGVLCLFLLDMGIVAARRLGDLRPGRGRAAAPLAFLVGFAVGFPLLNAALAATAAWMLGLPEGDALLLTILGASASYIAVPAALRLALPEANPSIYLTMSLAITFPFNILLGIPLYHQVVRALAGL
ncbi:MAG: sodium-dependent bicarbonate transport family permease [Pseudomonadales bacterium]